MFTDGDFSASNLESGNGGRGRGSLAKEGIMPVASKSTPARKSSHRAGRIMTDQEKNEVVWFDSGLPIQQQPKERRRSSHSSPVPTPSSSSASSSSSMPASSSSSHTDPSMTSSIYLPKAQWISLGDGWFQCTPESSGSSSRAGLHSVIEASAPGGTFMCLYEPRTVEAINAITSQSPDYDIEVQSKIFSDPLGQSTLKSRVMFAVKSPAQYMYLEACCKSRKWSVKMVQNFTMLTSVADVVDPNLRPGVFSSILIQIRSPNGISIDINGIPTFTGIKVPSEAMSLSGLVGVMAKGSKFAIKGWKIRAGQSADAMSFNLPSPLPSPSTTTSMNTNQINKGSASDSRGNSNLNGGPPKPKSLSEVVALKESSSTNSAASSLHDRLGDAPVPIGGGGPGKPVKSLSPPPPPSYASDGFRSNDSSRDENHRLKGVDEDFMTDGGNNEETPIFEEDSLDIRIARCVSILKESHDTNLVDTVMRDVIQRDLCVDFNDIAALENAKRLLNEAIVLPILMPEFFTGIREPWKGVLLFGPPGTGKTLLAKAVAGINSSVFFSCAASSLISKFRGESEKLVRCLFEAARLMTPSIIFLDEVDALVSARGNEGEHEASRRLKTEFFAQMDGVVSTNGEGNVMVLCTTNCPWDLDEAMRRRLEKRIYIPLPDMLARVDLFSICLRDIPVADDVEVGALAALTEGYSGADIHLVCREASMIPMRKLLAQHSPVEMQKLKRSGALGIPPVQMEDFEAAILCTRPSVGDIRKFEEWDAEFGSK